MRRIAGRLQVIRPAKHRVIAVVIPVLTGLLASGALIGVHMLGQPIPGGTSTLSGSGEPVVVDASYAHGFSTVSAMASASDLVADGTIVSGTLDPQAQPVPSTDYVFHIIKAIAHSKSVPVDSEIVVHQAGGGDGNGTAEVEGFPPFKTGEHVILFLTEYAPGKYYVISGPKGAFTVSGEQVTARSRDHVASFHGPMALSDFTALIAN